MECQLQIIIILNLVNFFFDFDAFWCMKLQFIFVTARRFATLQVFKNFLNIQIKFAFIHRFDTFSYSFKIPVPHAKYGDSFQILLRGNPDYHFRGNQHHHFTLSHNVNKTLILLSKTAVLQSFSSKKDLAGFLLQGQFSYLVLPLVLYQALPKIKDFASKINP